MAYKTNGNTFFNDSSNLGLSPGVTGLSIDSEAGSITIGGSPVIGTVAGYTSGGGIPSTNTIDKFPFAADANATDVGDLTVARSVTAGQSSYTHGYASGGAVDTPPSITNNNTIDKFPFASSGNATDVGDLINNVRGESGQSSSVSGYVSGGGYNPTPGNTNTIDKFPFATNTNATDVGDLTVLKVGLAGQSSTTNGYISGGIPSSNIIEKFPFASDSNATDVGDLTSARGRVAGQSSTVSGYTSGGLAPGPAQVNTIDKFPFVSDSNATDVGDLTSVRSTLSGQQD